MIIIFRQLLYNHFLLYNALPIKMFFYLYPNINIVFDFFFKKKKQFPFKLVIFPQDKSL